jgi:soluble lytic murein transglycosylase-like protein
MQLIDTTAAEMGVVNVWDPEDNIFGGAKYLSKLLNRFEGNVKNAVASYNAGPEAVKKYNGIPPYKETRNYVEKVMNYFEYFRQLKEPTNEEN